MHRINGLQSFICKRNGETYTEVLSDTKIEIRNNMIITPLSEYYEICDSLTVKQLMVEKRELLEDYLDINEEHMRTR